MAGSIPVELLTIKGQIAVRWVDGTDADFTLPFLKDTISRQTGRGHKQSLTLASELSQLPPRQPPTAFIFHMSRCGSTLVSRMLAAVERFHVVSEPVCINDALMLESIDEPARALLLRGLINALAPQESHPSGAYFLKLSSWNALHLALFKKLYPQTPWLFVHRNPVDVLASHARKSANWEEDALIRRCGELGARVDGEPGSSERTANILASVCWQVSQYADPASSLLLDYVELPSALYEKAATFLELELSEKEMHCMHAVSLNNSKQTDQPWRGNERAGEGLTEIRVITNQYLDPAYEQLQLKGRCLY